MKSFILVSKIKHIKLFTKSIDGFCFLGDDYLEKKRYKKLLKLIKSTNHPCFIQFNFKYYDKMQPQIYEFITYFKRWITSFIICDLGLYLTIKSIDENIAVIFDGNISIRSNEELQSLLKLGVSGVFINGVIPGITVNSFSDFGDHRVFYSRRKIISSFAKVAGKRIKKGLTIFEETREKTPLLLLENQFGSSIFQEQTTKNPLVQNTVIYDYTFCIKRMKRFINLYKKESI